eukprot:11199551-Lingulodinium_polyedra.AAC.1
MVSDLNHEVLTRGGRLEIDGVAEDSDPLHYLMASLARQFEPFLDVIALKNTRDVMLFTRRAHAKTD